MVGLRSIAGAVVHTINVILAPLGWQLAQQPQEKHVCGAGLTPFFEPSASCQIPNWAFLLTELFGEKTDGVFVEVGAFDGESFSNTSCLADRGWTGLYVEPVPVFAERCRRRHAANPRVKVFELAIGADERRIRFFVGGPLTTSSPKLVADYESVAWARDAFARGERVEARQVTLDQFLETQGFRPGFDLLVVDVEGGEVDVFAGFDLARYRPSVMVVELADHHPELPAFRDDHAALFERICAAGYRVVYKDAINTVFRRVGG